ncbi:tetratricopeptide repeat protein [Mucilaginibacter sp. HMF5004]|uniref:tetratricopeptide repeat protein n=1 Tax=Mucilaginibacter rivuli TaxID=2857527 RepID=UPI001C5F5697|nr:tetratricopeptide repeat protein [Mucilaginibacter rivuli]MBW4891480.1 tetratricopeptide repeat protein [Mucilaginibacter rivuli]
MFHKATVLIVFALSISIACAQNSSNDSLARVLFVKKQTGKADSLTAIALSVAKPGTDNKQLNQALTQIDQALHIYSRYRDLDGVRQSFDNLAFVYHLQKKYSQEKWYILQSNTLSRTRLDTPNIINSLQKLAAVKCAIKDYGLAARDVNEVVYLAEQTANTPVKILALKSLAGIYQTTGDLKRSADILNKATRLQDSLNNYSVQQKAAANQTDSNARNNPTQQVGKTNGGSIINKKYIVLIISILILFIFIVYLVKWMKNKGKSGV